jgi:tetrahydromethanopterin S-methyltransferase subunit G
MKESTKRETDTEFLARLMAEGFGRVNDRLETIDSRFDIVDNRFLFLEKGQAKTHRRLDSIERKQGGMLESLDESVHRSEFARLVQRVEILEIEK